MKEIWLAAAILACAALGSAHAQESESRTQRIAKALARMDSSNAVERQVATEENLDANDAILRSQALAKALHVDDKVVRELAISHLIEVQKAWMLDIEVSDRSLRALPSQLQATFTDLKTANLDISNYDQKTGKFNALLDTGRNTFSGGGAVNQDGLSVQLFMVLGLCRLYFKGENDGFLIGALACPTASFPVKAALQ